MCGSQLLRHDMDSDDVNYQTSAIPANSLSRQSTYNLEQCHYQDQQLKVRTYVKSEKLISGYGKTGDGMLRHNDGVPPAPTPYVHLLTCRT